MNLQPEAPSISSFVENESFHHLSVMDLFRVGIGPSSSHTVGPMRAGCAFIREFSRVLPDVQPGRITVDLFGSLAATGRGHNTDRATLLGLVGHDPESIRTEAVESILPWIAENRTLPIGQALSQDSEQTYTLNPYKPVPFNLTSDLVFHPLTVLPYHVNALTITAWKSDAPVPLLQRTYYSVGGGFVMAQLSDQLDSAGNTENPQVVPLESSHSEVSTPSPENTSDTVPATCPYPFTTSAQLLALCREHGLSIAALVRANEESHCSRYDLDTYLDLVANTMFDCIDAGMTTTGLLPGGLDVPRRAQALAEKLRERTVPATQTLHTHLNGQTGAATWASTPNDPLRAMDWVNLYALAVNEENAAGHRVVTAPTNGAAGVIPAVLGYLTAYCPEAGVPFGQFAPASQSGTTSVRLCAEDTHESACRRRRAVHDFLLTATAVGSLIKRNASIAGAEVGCQGEVGSASAMAAAGLAQALGGTPEQVENAAEIAMEHSLGLTCDPVGGLVQIPCIERNAIAAVKAINAARMAMWGDGRHTVTLDAVIETMRQTGHDMLSKYKETSSGGLAVNVVEC